jgi:hypothetical protein
MVAPSSRQLDHQQRFQIKLDLSRWKTRGVQLEMGKEQTMWPVKLKELWPNAVTNDTRTT